MLTDLIAQIHAELRGAYGFRLVHAELSLGPGVMVGHNQGELLIRRASFQTATVRTSCGSPKSPNIPRLGFEPSPQRLLL